jgi:peptidoglycan/LPS O-acetylase OafA/YrhL
VNDHKTYRSDIQGLRAVAILLVVLYHSGAPGITGGFIGVDVFFVISGYLITSLLVAEITGEGRIDLWRFYARRIRRLLPASCLMLLAVLVASIAVLSPIEQVEIAKSGLSTALYVSNFWFSIQSNDYFAADTARNPFLHTWSLAVEEQFYLAWPILIILFSRNLRLALSIVTAGSFLLCLILMRHHHTLAFYATPPRAWEFGVGGLACLIGRAKLERVRPYAGALGTTGAMLVIGSAVLLTESTPSPGLAALPATLGSAFMLIAGASGANVVTRLLATWPMRRIGDVSYSWYLWHWPVLVFADLLVPGLPTPWRMALGLGSLIPAVLSYGLVENSARRSRWLRAAPIRSFGLGATFTAAGAAAALVLAGAADSALASPAQKRIAEVRSTISASQSHNCQSGYYDDTVKLCEIGARTGKIVVLFGDSHAAHWSSPLADIARRNGWRLVVVVKSCCGVARIPAIYNARERAYLTACPKWRETALRKIAALHPDLVIMSSWSTYVPAVGGTSRDHPISPAVWRDALHSTLAYFDSRGVRTVVIRDIPQRSSNAAICLSRAGGLGEDPMIVCATSPATAVNAPLVTAETMAMKGLKHSHLLDLSDQFCGRTCPPIRDGVMVYRDDSHVSEPYARLLAPVIAARLEKLERLDDIAPAKS